MRCRQGHVSPYLIATVYAGLGDKNEALNRLDQAYSERSWYLGFLRSDPELDSVRSEPRFQDLVGRMNFPPYHQQKQRGRSGRDGGVFALWSGSVKIRKSALKSRGSAQIASTGTGICVKLFVPS